MAIGPMKPGRRKRVREHPYLLIHLEECSSEHVYTLEQLASGRKRLAGSNRYYAHPLSDLPLTRSQIAAYEELLTGLAPEPREALTKAINRVNPVRLKQLQAQNEQANSRDWWLDAEALSRQAVAWEWKRFWLPPAPSTVSGVGSGVAEG